MPSTPDPAAVANVVVVNDESRVVLDDGLVPPEIPRPPQAVSAKPTTSAPGSTQRVITSV